MNDYVQGADFEIKEFFVGSSRSETNWGACESALFCLATVPGEMYR